MDNTKDIRASRRNPFDENPNFPLRHNVLNRRVRGQERNVGAAREKVAISCDKI